MPLYSISLLGTYTAEQHAIGRPLGPVPSSFGNGNRPWRLLCCHASVSMQFTARVLQFPISFLPCTLDGMESWYASSSHKCSVQVSADEELQASACACHGAIRCFRSRNMSVCTYNSTWSAGVPKASESKVGVLRAGTAGSGSCESWDRTLHQDR